MAKRPKKNIPIENIHSAEPITNHIASTLPWVVISDLVNIAYRVSPIVIPIVIVAAATTARAIFYYIYVNLPPSSPLESNTREQTVEVIQAKQRV
jgi:hypothetical protein